MKNIDKIIAEMPKIELHLHLEGAFTLPHLLHLIRKYDPDTFYKSIADLQERFRFIDFDNFIKTWFWKNQYFREPEDFYQSTYKAIAALTEQNIIALEAFFSPWDFIENKTTVPEIIEATIEGKKAAESKFEIVVNLIADVVRDHGYKTAPDRLAELVPYRQDICAIGLGGSEAQYPNVLFQEVFDTARQQGFHVVAHAGEASGAKSIWDALRFLKAERIGHGVRAIENASLMEYLAEHKVPLEICPTSNLKTKIVPDIALHPMRQMYAEGIPLTINSDDPTMFGTTLTEEFQLICQHLGFGSRDLQQFTLNALQASFFPEKTKAILKKKIDHFWQNN